MENEKINYTLINEVLEEYLNVYRNSPYVKNLGIYGEKALEVGTQLPINEEEKQWGKEIISKAKEISILTGIDIIKDYLNHLSPRLTEEFISQLEKGTTDIVYLDKDSLDDDWYSKKDTSNHCYIDQEFRPFINIATKKTTIGTLADLIHEFFHSTNRRDIHNHTNGFYWEMTTEFISIYFELDFLHWLVASQNYSKEVCLESYISRYYDAVICSDKLTDETMMLIKKENNGLLDESSYKVEPICEEDDYKEVLLSLSKRFEAYEKKQKIMASYQEVFNQEKKQRPLQPDILARYILGAPLAYYLASSKDPNMPYKMLDFNAEINTLSLNESFYKIGLTLDDIITLDYGKIMSTFKEEIIEIAKDQKDHLTKKTI